MKRNVMQTATLLLLLITGLAITSQGVMAAVSERVAVVRIKAIEGLDVNAASVQVNRSEQFVAGARYHISRAAVPSLDGIKTLVLIDHRTDALEGGDLVQNQKMEVLAVKGDRFSIRGPEGKELFYTVEVLSDGSVDVIGSGDKIVARPHGEYKVWKIEGASLVSRDRISLY